MAAAVMRRRPGCGISNDAPFPARSRVMTDDAVSTRPVADLAALGQLLEEHRPKLLGMLTRRLGPAVDFLVPEEILAQAFLDARQKWANRERFFSSYAWLYRVTLDRLIAEWRRVGRRHELPW